MLQNCYFEQNVNLVQIHYIPLQHYTRFTAVVSIKRKKTTPSKSFYISIDSIATRLPSQSLSRDGYLSPSLSSSSPPLVASVVSELLLPS
jgi:hypothetical protein